MKYAATTLARRTVMFVAQAAFLFMAAVSAYAHAMLVESTPSDNAVLKASPREVLLRFNARIEKGVSQFTLLDKKGRKLSLPLAPKEDTGDFPDRIVVSLPTLGPGTYRLQYLVLATDGHATPGILRFIVSEGAHK